MHVCSSTFLLRPTPTFLRVSLHYTDVVLNATLSTSIPFSQGHVKAFKNAKETVARELGRECELIVGVSECT